MAKHGRHADPVVCTRGRGNIVDIQELIDGPQHMGRMGLDVVEQCEGHGLLSERLQPPGDVNGKFARIDDAWHLLGCIGEAATNSTLAQVMAVARQRSRNRVADGDDNLASRDRLFDSLGRIRDVEICRADLAAELARFAMSEMVGVPGQALVMKPVEEHGLLHVQGEAESRVMTQCLVEPGGPGASGTDGQER